MRFRTAQSLAAEYKRDHQMYYLEFNGGGSENCKGQAILCSRLKMSMGSVNVYLSKGGGSFTVKRMNPSTGELDILTVTRGPTPITPQQQAKLDAPPKRRGRPPNESALRAEPEDKFDWQEWRKTHPKL